MESFLSTFKVSSLDRFLTPESSLATQPTSRKLKEGWIRIESYPN